MKKRKSKRLKRDWNTLTLYLLNKNKLKSRKQSSKLCKQGVKTQNTSSFWQIWVRLRKRPNLLLFGKHSKLRIKLQHQLINWANTKILSGKDSNQRRNRKNGEKIWILGSSRRSKDTTCKNHTQRWFGNQILNGFKSRVNIRWLIARDIFPDSLIQSGKKQKDNILTTKILVLTRPGILNTLKQSRRWIKLRGTLNIKSVRRNHVQDTISSTRQSKSRQWRLTSQLQSYKWSGNKLKLQMWKRMNLRGSSSNASMV